MKPAGKHGKHGKKKSIALPRRAWTINPVTRVKASAKEYERAKSKQDLRKETE
jgi:hypothetical protein